MTSFCRQLSQMSKRLKSVISVELRLSPWRRKSPIKENVSPEAGFSVSILGNRCITKSRCITIKSRSISLEIIVEKVVAQPMGLRLFISYILICIIHTGVATIISAPSWHAFCCSHILPPPYAHTVLMLYTLPNRLHSWYIWEQNKQNGKFKFPSIWLRSDSSEAY